jgi:hypothetical protein
MIRPRTLPYGSPFQPQFSVKIFSTTYSWLRCVSTGLHRRKRLQSLQSTLARGPTISSSPQALGECCHRSLARHGISVSWRSIFMMREDQCPHPWPCYGHARLEDTADNLAVRNHVEIVVVPQARPTKRRPLYKHPRVFFLHSLFFLAHIRGALLLIGQPVRLSHVPFRAPAG